jgi:hypothetical protein
MTRPAADNPRHPGPNPIDVDAAAFAAALDQAFTDQDTRNAQAAAFQAAVHDTNSHDVSAGPAPTEE